MQLFRPGISEDTEGRKCCNPSGCFIAERSALLEVIKGFMYLDDKTNLKLETLQARRSLVMQNEFLGNNT